MESKSHHNIQNLVIGILTGPAHPMDKVQRIVSLGYDEEEADILVERYQSGMREPVFYEELHGPDYAGSDENDS